MREKDILRIQELLDEMVETGFVSGVNCMMIQDGKEIFYKEAGLRDLERQLPMTRDTIFRLYSMSKVITAAAVLLLVEDGNIDLMDPASKYLPGFQEAHLLINGRRENPVPDVTIQKLLNMTSGMVYPGEDSPAGLHMEKLLREVIEKLDTEEALSTVEIANRAGRGPLAFQPGTSWQYGFSADILGAIVEVVSGKRFGEFLKERIFDPLGMKDTAFYVPEEKQERLAKVYEGTPEGLSLYTYPHLGIQNEMKRDPAFESGGAGLVSTIDDYARFNRMLLGMGSLEGVRVMNPATVAYMTDGGLTQAEQSSMDQWEGLRGYTYANLMRVLKNPGMAVSMGSKGEYGWDGWLGAYMTNDPAHQMTLLMMYQKVDAGTTSYTRRLRNLVFSSLEL